MGNNGKKTRWGWLLAALLFMFALMAVFTSLAVQSTHGH